ncbi:MAG: GNAT family N-acetyltransferase [Actinomycetia bacterium]|nr:GNAT family N-acetyltransferase [Actinomycetes bacterium]
MIEIVPNEPQFYEFIRVLRNDERVKHGFINEAVITPEQQTEYMAIHADEYVVSLYDGSPAGYAGSVDGDIRVCTHPDYQGRGLGRALVEAIIGRYPNSRAKVKVENTASLRLFESCGFTATYLLLDPPSDDSLDTREKD